MPAESTVELMPSSISMRTSNGALLAARAREEKNRVANEAKGEFAQDFTRLAADPERFHELMRKVYGSGYDTAMAEALRVRTLKGDTSWLPPIEWVSDADMNGGLGAYASGVIYLNEALLGEPDLAAAVYAEEVGHALDAQLNVKDTVGDEGELFRRLLYGEPLSDRDIAAIRSENDHGLIVVDGKEVEVEFFFKKIARAVAKPFKAVGKAVGKAAKSIGSGLSTIARGVGGFFKGVGGFVSNAVRFRFGRAFDSLYSGIDRLVVGTFNGAMRVIDGPLELLGPIGEPLKRIKRRLEATTRAALQASLGVMLGVARGLTEGVLQIGGGLAKVLTGRFKQGFREIGSGLMQVAVKTPVNAIILGAGSTVSALQTLIGIEAQGEPLSDDEIAYLRTIYGDAIDYDAVRVKRGSAGLFSVNDRPFVLGNTIYMKDVDSAAVLAHELMHVWQYQNGGSDYLIEALVSQQWGRGYDWEQSVPQTPWAELEPEQQAQLFEDAFADGFFDPPAPGTGRFLWQGVDYTEYLLAAWDEVRAGRGAP